MSANANQPAMGSYSVRLDELGYLKRSPYAPLAFILPAFLSGASWAMGGQAWLTDIAFGLLTAICLTYLILELYSFPKRFGIGGLILYGGVLMWFSHDYFTHWLGHGFDNANEVFEPVILAKATFCHCLFILFISLGLYIPFYRPVVRVIHLVPEPNTQSFYLWMLLGLFFMGIAPYLFFTRESFFVSVWNDMWAMRSGGGARWTVGRTGNVNFSFGAYIAVLVQMGQIGGQLAVFYALLIARNNFSKLFAWSIWAFWMALAFGSGTRGQVLFMGLPAIALLYLKYQAIAAWLTQRLSLRAYLYTGLIALFILFLVQFQGFYRSEGVSSFETQSSSFKIFNLKGNTMFSEGLLGFALIPDVEKHFYDSVPGMTIVRPIPQTIYWFLVGPIPRALWTSKPIDPVWEWYNFAFTGGRHSTGGTTISQGLVGYWYFRYGIPGLIEGGLLLGWLMLVAEKALQRSEGMPMRVLFSLGFATWLFRVFRGMNFNDLYPLMIGGLMLFVIIKVVNTSTAPPYQQISTTPANSPQLR